MARRGVPGVRMTLLALVAAGVAAVPAAAGEEVAQPPVFGVEADVVHVTVAVRDKGGRFVSDLQAADFTVEEDGRRQRIELFARAFEPGKDEAMALDLGLLMDTSQSMLEELKLSQEAATRFLEAIPRARELYTVFFADDIRLSRYDSENQQGLFERIHAAKGGGNTCLYDAIAVYLSRVAGRSGRKVMVLFTDGEDSRSELALGEVMELLRASGVTAFPIAFGAGLRPGTSRALRARAVLLQLADLTGGRVFTPHSSKDLPDIYQAILDELGAQYVIGFVSDGRAASDRYRKLKVKVRRGGLDVRHRNGYYPKPAPRP